MTLPAVTLSPLRRRSPANSFPLSLPGCGDHRQTKARTLARRRKVSDKHTAWVHATSSSINAFIAKQRLTDRARRVSAYNELAELYSRKAKIEAEILSKAKRLEVALECALKELGVVVQGRREEIDQVFSAAKTEQQEQEMER